MTLSMMTGTGLAERIGIVACSAEGAALCYRTFCAEAAAILGPYAHPDVCLHGRSLACYVELLDQGDWEGVAGLMLSSAEALARAGADLLVCPDNTIHQALPLLRHRSPLPWLHIADVVADEATRRGYTRLGILGTEWLMEGSVYSTVLGSRGVSALIPQPDDRGAIHTVIMDELVHGLVRQESLQRCQDAVLRLSDLGCEAVVLGCTELPLLLNDANTPLPTLDSTRLLARAAAVATCGLPHHVPPTPA